MTMGFVCPACGLYTDEENPCRCELQTEIVRLQAENEQLVADVKFHADRNTMLQAENRRLMEFISAISEAIDSANKSILETLVEIPIIGKIISILWIGRR